MFRSDGIDVVARPPFESGGFCDSWEEFDVPVVVVVGRAIQGSGVDEVVVRRAVEGPFEFAHELADQFMVLSRGEVVASGAQAAMNDPEVKRHLAV